MSEREPAPNLPASQSPSPNAPDATPDQKAHLPHWQDTRAVDGKTAQNLPPGEELEQKQKING